MGSPKSREMRRDTTLRNGELGKLRLLVDRSTYLESIVLVKLMKIIKFIKEVCFRYISITIVCNLY